MTAVETARLIEWLQSMGFSASDACSCIKFMATGTGLPERPEKKPEGAPKE